MTLAAVWNVLEARTPGPLVYAAALIVAGTVVALIVAQARGLILEGG